MEPEICICAAIKLHNGYVIRGHRHSDCIRNVMARPNSAELLPIKQDQQGFITSKNRFVSRTEAAMLQNKAGILSVYTGSPVKDILFSEDLY